MCLKYDSATYLQPFYVKLGGSRNSLWFREVGELEYFHGLYVKEMSLLAFLLQEYKSIIVIWKTNCVNVDFSDLGCLEVKCLIHM